MENAYDMLWREGLMIKLLEMGVGGIMFNWISDFFNLLISTPHIGNYS